ncbi:uncharacterized protein PRCAT00004500001 [Priceomyces carsonii]|uniref:uncharacterized protein n=1 Tax=Priceomyces carsonii TaxID=28549 RepID=UPI002ED862D7|nr:unnamed protein product [Priceomyces carsonii]
MPGIPSMVIKPDKGVNIILRNVRRTTPIVSYSPQIYDGLTPCTKVQWVLKIQKNPQNNLHLMTIRKQSNATNGPDKKEQERKANLGSMVDELRVLIPNILNKSLPKSIISSGILLRIVPTHLEELNGYLPNIKGHVSYYATCKTLQLILTSVVLSPKVKLHIQKIKVSKDSDYKCIYPESTKIEVRWTTCLEGCAHLSQEDGKHKSEDTSYHSTSDAKLGSHSWSKVDPVKALKHNKSNNVTTTLPSLTSTISHWTSGLIGLTKENKKLERIISGIFIFELNDDNNKIIVHTIEDVDVIEKTEAEDVDGELRIC